MNMIRETKIYICIDAPCIEILQTPTLHQTTSHAPFPQAESLAYHQPNLENALDSTVKNKKVSLNI